MFTEERFRHGKQGTACGVKGRPRLPAVRDGLLREVHEVHQCECLH